MGHTRVEKEGYLRRLADFIGKDTMSRNESKKLIVVIRILILSIGAYFVLDAIMCRTAFRAGGMLVYAAFIGAFAVLFAMSYRSGTKAVLWLFNIAMLLWVWISVHCFGWNVGAQHFLMMLLVLDFFSGYKQYKGKVVFALLLCVYRIALLFLYQYRKPVFLLTAAEESACQILHVILIFWCISVIAYSFSKDSQELEGKLVEYNNQLKRQADTDMLTGLPNRRKAEEYLKTISREQVNDTGCSLCICDIDFFKRVNDKYGHNTGDQVLKETSRIFREEMTGRDFAARWGGEEFLLLFPASNGDNAYIKLEQIRRRIKNFRFNKEEEEFGITLTFGLAEYDFRNGFQATIKEADQKLYIGKDGGRDRIVF